MKEAIEIVKTVQLPEDEMDKMSYKDCFQAITLVLLKEPFLSGDMKHIIIHGMFSILRKKGYTEDQISIFAEKMLKVVDTFEVTNEFMG